jgi:beta-galactosidase
LLILISAARGQDYLWIEGEQPTSKNVEIKAEAFGQTELLSGGKWLKLQIEQQDVAKNLPKEGALLGYQFQVFAAGNYEVWSRIGYEGIRSPFEWRIDQGPWYPVQPTDPSIDLSDLATWSPVAWLNLGKADLAAGKHVFEFRVKAWSKVENGKQVPQGMLFACDAICLSKGAFHPNGKFKPGEDWQNKKDKEAARQVFEFKAGGREGYANSPERVELSLGGLWQVARFDEMEVVDRDGPTTTVPDASQLFWMGTTVPGNKFQDRSELIQCHRLIYRTRVKVPAATRDTGYPAGRSFIFRFPVVNLFASLLVNGRYCGFTKAPYALWECDATSAIRPGEVNEVCVVIKDSYYAVSPKLAGSPTRNSFGMPLDMLGQSWMMAHFDYPIGSGVAGGVVQLSGILVTPSLVVAGPVYTSDVFAIPSVKKKTLGLEITVSNPTSQEQKVQLVNEIVPAALTASPSAATTPSAAQRSAAPGWVLGKAEKVFAPTEVKLAAGKEQVVKLSEPWADPKLWWPDDPRMYVVVTKVVLDGKVADVRQTPFGFRQWEWDSPQFKLNGLPWNLRGDTGFGVDGSGQSTVQETVDHLRQSHANHIRYWKTVGCGGLTNSQVLDEMDAAGIVARRDGIMDGMGCNYLHAIGGNKGLFDNWEIQLRAWVKEERNHPSIFAWSIENELTLINARNLGQLDGVEPRIKEAARIVMAMDPTRPAMIDGGNCLRDQSLPVNGSHYIEGGITPPGIALREYPDQAYTWDKIIPNEKQCFPLALDRPILMGECAFISGMTPGEVGEFGGETCFAGWGPATARGAGLFAKMLTEGFRWRDVAGWQFCAGDGEFGGLQCNSQKPVALFCRQWNWTFGSGSTVARTLKLFNDTRFGGPIEAGWQLLVDNKQVAGETKHFEMSACEHREFDIAVQVPRVAQRTAGQFVLTCTRGGKEVFRDVKPVWVIDPNPGPKPALADRDLIVLDPQGSVKQRLTARGIAFTEVRSLAEIPLRPATVVVGRDALSAREATDPKWLALAGNGAKVLVLDQANPLHYQALPADIVPTDFVGRVAFEENTAHPIFQGLEQDDFFTWASCRTRQADHVVYRNVYTKPTRGATSLAHCDKELGYSAIAECPVNEGLLLLCQMVVGEKLDCEPAAQRLFDNMLAYCASYVPVRHATAVVMSGGSPALKLLGSLGLKFDRAGDVLSAAGDGKHRIVIFDATPAALQSLAANQDKVRDFTAKGGWLMAWGVAPGGLASFNKLVGVEHVLRPFEMEKVNLPAQRDPLLAGLTVRDVAMESTIQMYPWFGTKFDVDDEFSYIVDYDDIGPFCEVPGFAPGDHAAARKAQANWARNVFSGFPNEWILNYYMNNAAPKLELKLPRPEVVKHMAIVLNCDYAPAQQINLYFDNDPKPIVLRTKPDRSRQEFDLTPRQASRLVIELADLRLDKPGPTGLGYVRLEVDRSPEWRQKVKPLLSIGGLVKYPMGEGGVVLNQLLIKPAEENPGNAQKKSNIVAGLLRNMHATFEGGKVLTAANLTYQPLPLDEKCNQYLSKDRGWFGGDRDLTHIPVGNQTLGGVTYMIRDHRTSPVPSCVMLAGPGAHGKLPTAVRGLKVGCKADVLFFLHTFNQTEARWALVPKDRPPAMVFKYVIHYADGQTADVPVRLSEGVDHWITKSPAGLKNAALAWAASFPGDKSGDQAVLYQLAWTNPRPKETIASIDLVRGPDGSDGGTPVLLAITAARAP